MPPALSQPDCVLETTEHKFLIEPSAALKSQHNKQSTKTIGFGVVLSYSLIDRIARLLLAGWQFAIVNSADEIIKKITTFLLATILEFSLLFFLIYFFYSSLCCVYCSFVRMKCLPFYCKSLCPLCFYTSCAIFNYKCSIVLLFFIYRSHNAIQLFFSSLPFCEIITLHLNNSTHSNEETSKDNREIHDFSSPEGKYLPPPTHFRSNVRVTRVTRGT